MQGLLQRSCCEKHLQGFCSLISSKTAPKAWLVFDYTLPMWCVHSPACAAQSWNTSQLFPALSTSREKTGSSVFERHFRALFYTATNSVTLVLWERCSRRIWCNRSRVKAEGSPRREESNKVKWAGGHSSSLGTSQWQLNYSGWTVRRVFSVVCTRATLWVFHVGSRDDYVVTGGVGALMKKGTSPRGCSTSPCSRGTSLE